MSGAPIDYRPAGYLPWLKEEHTPTGRIPWRLFFMLFASVMMCGGTLAGAYFALRPESAEATPTPSPTASSTPTASPSPSITAPGESFVTQTATDSPLATLSGATWWRWRAWAAALTPTISPEATIEPENTFELGPTFTLTPTPTPSSESASVQQAQPRQQQQQIVVYRDRQVVVTSPPEIRYRDVVREVTRQVVVTSPPIFIVVTATPTATVPILYEETPRPTIDPETTIEPRPTLYAENDPCGGLSGIICLPTAPVLEGFRR